MRVHYIQHVAHEGPANVAAWARQRGHEVTGTHLHRGESLPGLDGVDWLVVLGGPMSVHDADEYDWLPAERTLIERAVAGDCAVIGICLGAQQLAAALGGTVEEMDAPEQGWAPVRATPGGANAPGFEALPEEYVAFHWHGEQCSVPADATLTAETDACPTQAFVDPDRRAAGLQFHLEATPDSVATLLGAADPGEGPHVQSVEAMLGAERAPRAAADHLRAFLDSLAAHWAD